MKLLLCGSHRQGVADLMKILHGVPMLSEEDQPKGGPADPWFVFNNHRLLCGCCGDRYDDADAALRTLYEAILPRYYGQDGLFAVASVNEWTSDMGNDWDMTIGCSDNEMTVIRAQNIYTKYAGRRMTYEEWAELCGANHLGQLLDKLLRR
ncbi:hypothetical protein [uncultured Rothia sp.]|uniref:hypothetical protein n=1 Tax=uncultured Rothia sp. TaxID=316088 RepID=UPI0025E6277B|nr:hypothetical protein [uncultured Rothia sp.]